MFHDLKVKKYLAFQQKLESSPVTKIREYYLAVNSVYILDNTTAVFLFKIAS